MRYDLHTHSTVSDGRLAPGDVVRKAAEARLDGIALTDHDSTGGIEEAREAAAAAGVDVLLGCEVSAELDGHSVHVLGYFMDPTHPRWVEELRWIRDDRVVRAEKMVEKLQALGVPVTIEMVRAHARGESVGRPHVAAALVELGVVATTSDAFTEEWIGDNGRANVAKRVMSPEETVRLIGEAGGVAVIAHPVWIERQIGPAEPVIEACVAAGLAGLEVDHPDQDLDWRIRFRKLAERFDLVTTGSSDYHASEHGGPIGANTSGEDVVAALRARAGRAAG